MENLLHIMIKKQTFKYYSVFNTHTVPQWTYNCSEVTMETPEQCAKPYQLYNYHISTILYNIYI